jgi:hypothetical protein
MIYDTIPEGCKFITQTDFAKKHGDKKPLTLSAIDYLIRQGIVDAFRMGTTRYIIVNEKSEKYRPNRKRAAEAEDVKNG